MQTKTSGFCRIFLMFLLAVMPLYYGSVDLWVIYPIEATVFLLIFLWFFGMILKGEIHVQRLAPAPYLGMFVLLCLISFIQTDYRWVGRRELLFYMAGVGVYFLAAHHLNRIRYLRLLNRILLILGTTLALIGILQYFKVVAHPWWKGYKLSATYVNKNHFAGYLNLIIPFAVTGAYFGRDLGKRILMFYSLAVMFAALLFTFSRGGWISLLFSSIFLSLTLFGPERKKLKWTLASIFAVPIFILLFADVGVKNIENIWQKGEGDEINLPVRRKIYRSTLAMISDHWVLGTGPGSFAEAFPRYRVAGLDFRVDYAHNDYLQAMAELGLGALPLIVLIAWTSFRAAWRKIHLVTSQTEKGMILASLAGIISILVHSALDFNLHIPANAFLFMVLLGLASAHPISAKECQ
jgi:O-antigen ligase